MSVDELLEIVYAPFNLSLRSKLFGQFLQFSDVIDKHVVKVFDYYFIIASIIYKVFFAFLEDADKLIILFFKFALLQVKGIVFK